METTTALESLTSSVKALETNLGAAIAQRDAELKTIGKATEETAKLVNETGTKLAEQKSELLAKLEELEKEQKARLDEVERKLGRAGPFVTAREALDGGRSSIAKAFTGSPAYQAKLKSKSRLVDPVLVKSFFPGASPEAVKALLTSDTDGLVAAQRIAPLPMQRRVLRVRDLLPVRSTTANSLEYVEVTGFAPATGTNATTALAQSAGVATLDSASNHGLQDGDLVRIAGANQTEYNGDHYITVVDADEFTFSVDSGATSPATGTITWKKLNNQAGAAAAVAEGDTKPEAMLVHQLRTAAAKKIAHWLAASDEILNDEAQMQAQIEDHLLNGIEFAEEVALLYGSGTGANLQGLMTHPRAQTYAWSDGATLPVPDTKIDAIRRGMTKAQVREYVPTGLVTNPNDWQDIELAKGDDGHYIWLSIPSGAGQRFFALPVVVTNAINAGEALVGSFANGAQLWDREDAHISIAEQHDDYWVKNLVGIMAEERVIFPIFRPDSFVIVDFDAEPS